MRRAASVAVALATLGGCYHLGFEPKPEIGSELAVPIFENKTLRRGLEHSLTDKVRKEVLLRTPLHLGHEGSTRAVLLGAVVSVNENVLVAGQADEILEASILIAVEVSVVERGTGRLLVGKDEDGDGRPDGPIALSDSQPYRASRGETRDTASERVLRDLAERIVQLLEKEWGGAEGPR